MFSLGHWQSKILREYREGEPIKFGIEMSPRNIEDNQISLNARQ